MSPGKHTNAKSLAARFVLVAALVLASFAHTAFQPKVSTPKGFDERANALHVWRLL